MFVNLKIFIAMGNPFVLAYTQSDVLGKAIFIGLIALSICSWVIILHKLWLTYHARNQSAQFYAAFQMQKAHPLSLECEGAVRYPLSPFFSLYNVLKKQTLEILSKNRRFGVTMTSTPTEHSLEQSVSPPSTSTSYLSPTDVECLDAHLMSSIAAQTQRLEKNLFILSTIVTLGPFLGLLGTVWGILTTFAEMQTHTGGGSNNMVLGGISLALATTVLGLVDAIPALIGYNYLKNETGALQTDMEGFATELLVAVEMQYRKVDVR